MRKKYLNNKGLSLVEVVMSALIVAVLMAGLYSVYVSAKNMTALALHKTVALGWAASGLEARKSGMVTAYTDPAANNILANDKGGAVAINDTSYQNSMIRHSVTVTWTE
ncbi:MAG: prepilin-type N-terminal cleavage/methylation domain-containing protein [Candidatus Omnitrophica bacterium]|nr:prepilin-type N-terminal cleavage/methylation domain-containing protein [Candidatus Omnitrophota bacterium]